jgi:hypothetical protein
MSDDQCDELRLLGQTVRGSVKVCPLLSVAHLLWQMVVGLGHFLPIVWMQQMWHAFGPPWMKRYGAL